MIQLPPTSVLILSVVQQGCPENATPRDPIPNDQVIEGGFDTVFGVVTWQTLISGDKTNSNGLILGVATFPPQGVLHLHRYTPQEFYFGLTESGTIMLDGQPVQIAPGTSVFIPSSAEHGVTAVPKGLVMAHGFGEDAFSEIEYRFSAGQ